MKVIILLLTVVFYLSGCTKLYYSYIYENTTDEDKDIYILKNDNLDKIRYYAANNYSGYYQKVVVKSNNQGYLNASEVTDNYVLFGIINESKSNCYVIFKNPWKYYGVFDYGWCGFAKVYFNHNTAYVSNSSEYTNNKDKSYDLLVEIFP